MLVLKKKDTDTHMTGLECRSAVGTSVVAADGG